MFVTNIENFIEDALHERIANKLVNFFNKKNYEPPSENEVTSWKNSLKALAEVLNDIDLNGVQVILEHMLPNISKRIDCVLCGQDSNGNNNAIFIELKQWSQCIPSAVEKHVIVNQKRKIHPSEQVLQYANFCKVNNSAFYENAEKVKIYPCAFLHNGNEKSLYPLFRNYETLLKEAPLFIKETTPLFKTFLKNKLSNGNGKIVTAKIEDGKKCPSPSLKKEIANIIDSKKELRLLDKEITAFNAIVTLDQESQENNKKAVLIIKGGPGTGKTAIALQALAYFLKKGYKIQYSAGSQAVIQSYRKNYSKTGTYTASSILTYFNRYKEKDRNSQDIILCDESHRIRTEEHERTAQIKKVVGAARLTVFFIDEAQKINPDELANVAEIQKTALEVTNNVKIIELNGQFRCGGSEKYIHFIKQQLKRKEFKKKIFWQNTPNFEFKICKTPQELEKAIKEKDKANYNARLCAGLCWEWNFPKNNRLPHDIVIEEYNYSAPWNAKKQTEDAPESTFWPIDPRGINQVGCIYTIQNFSFDYLGIIFGQDMIYDPQKEKWIGQKSNCYNFKMQKVKESMSDEDYLEDIKGAYWTLLTRAHKGCYVFFQDKNTREFFEKFVISNN